MDDKKPQRPDWAYDGAEIYIARGVWNGPDHITPCTVLRATPTQIIVKLTSREERYRIADLTRVGDTGRTGNRLVPGDDTVVIKAKLRAAIRESMSDLVKLHGEAGQQARLFTSELDQALGWAKSFKIAAEAAVAGLEQATRDYPEVS